MHPEPVVRNPQSDLCDTGGEERSAESIGVPDLIPPDSHICIGWSRRRGEVVSPEVV